MSFSQARSVGTSGPAPPVISSDYRLPSAIEVSPMMVLTTGEDRLPVRIIDPGKVHEAPEVQPDQDVFMILDTYVWVEREDGKIHNRHVRDWLSASGCDLKWTSGQRSAFNATVKAMKKTKPQLSGHVNNNPTTGSPPRALATSSANPPPILPTLPRPLDGMTPTGRDEGCFLEGPGMGLGRRRPGLDGRHPTTGESGRAGACVRARMRFKGARIRELRGKPD
ncbi:hypothetical protein ACJZ2D_013052 [Fusarium nematophilum]